MQRQTNVAQGEQCRRLRVVVGAGLFHHRQIDTRLFQRRDVAERQLHFFPRIACRVEIEAAAVNQIGVFQQIARFPVRQIVAVIPLGEKIRQRGIFHPEEINIDLVNVERQHRQSLRQAQRQQRATTGKTDHRLDVARGECLAEWAG